MLAELEATGSFALLGPGFGGGSWRLMTGLRAAARWEPAPVLALLGFDQRPGEVLRYRGEVRPIPPPPLDQPRVLPAPVLDLAGYTEAVTQIRAAIAAGDVYQVNLTRMARLGDVSARALVSALWRAGAPPYAAWVRTPDGCELVSASPERFFAVDGGRICCEPMKGTAAPGDRARLAASAKDCAELAMITDLVRNDLTPLCRPRSVTVDEARRFIDLPYAVQTVSRVSGLLAGPFDSGAALEALHPCGSVSGAPKGAALAQIARLEPEPRGLYCGTLGLVEGQRAVFSVLIRTAERAAQGWRYGVGSGLVWDSDPEAEAAEVRLKLGPLDR